MSSLNPEERQFGLETKSKIPCLGAESLDTSWQIDNREQLETAKAHEPSISEGGTNLLLSEIVKQKEIISCFAINNRLARFKAAVFRCLLHELGDGKFSDVLERIASGSLSKELTDKLLCHSDRDSYLFHALLFEKALIRSLVSADPQFEHFQLLYPDSELVLHQPFANYIERQLSSDGIKRTEDYYALTFHSECAKLFVLGILSKERTNLIIQALARNTRSSVTFNVSVLNNMFSIEVAYLKAERESPPEPFSYSTPAYTENAQLITSFLERSVEQNSFPDLKLQIDSNELAIMGSPSKLLASKLMAELLCAFPKCVAEWRQSAQGPTIKLYWGSAEEDVQAFPAFEHFALFTTWGVQVGHELLTLVDPARGGKLLDAIATLRDQLQSLGLLLPVCRITDDLTLPPASVRISLGDVPIANPDFIRFPHFIAGLDNVSNELEIIGLLQLVCLAHQRRSAV